MALQGNEILQVTGITPSGMPSSVSEQTTTQAIADLAVLDTSNIVNTPLTTIGNGTILAAGIVGKIVSRSGYQSGAITDTTDTAANIIAALPASAPIGTSFQYKYVNNGNTTVTIAGGLGVTVSGYDVAATGSWIEFLVTYSGAGAVTMVGIDSATNDAMLVQTQYTAAGITNNVFAAGQITGGTYTIFDQTANTPGTVNTRTAALMLSDIPNSYNGLNYILRVIQAGTGTLTIGAGSNVTITGTAAISTGWWREYAVTLGSISSATLQNIGGSTTI